jgi:hypothetical protein
LKLSVLASDWGQVLKLSVLPIGVRARKLHVAPLAHLSARLLR